jgi:hypothetical protein
MAQPGPSYRRPGGGRAGGHHARGGGRGKTWAVGLFTAALVAGGAGLIGWTKINAVQLDPANSCPLSGPVTVHAVLLDQSDPISPLQVQRLRQLVNRLVEEAEVGERIDLYVLAANAVQAMTPRLSLCRPKSEGNILYENPEHIRKGYVARFQQPLDDALTQLTQLSSSNVSPIMESIKAVCIAAFGSLPPGVPTKLTIASDMIQYSSLLDHYKQRDFEAFSHTPPYNEVVTDCHRARVNVLYLIRPRDARIQDRKHELFWEKFFDHIDATLVRMEPT